MRVRKPAEIKGTAEGVYIFMNDQFEFLECMKSLEDSISKTISFFKDAKIIGTKGINLNYTQKAEVEKLISGKYNIEVVSLESIEFKAIKKVEETKRIADEKILKEEARKREIEQEIRKERERNEKPEEVLIPIVDSKQMLEEGMTKTILNTLRSGMGVKFDGNVIIVGDVKPGAEVVATGNILVMGKLLGLAHAGCSGNEDAVIIANCLDPIQLRISKYILRTSDKRKKSEYFTEKAYLEGKDIIIKKNS